jgi:hypothetical protein
MASPFPGMDPYLEGNLWTSFHALLATEIVRQLNPLLRPKYIAAPERQVIPDVGIRKTKSQSVAAGGVATVSRSLRLRSRITTKVPHFHIDIRDVKDRRLVTAIELLSPTNKRGGRKEYLRKRRRFLKSGVHLLEIDLHHQGRRVPLLDPYPPGAYFALLSRARKRTWTDVWHVPIEQPLPTVAVPLLKGDADVPLDLQDAFTKVYEVASFDLEVDYREPPDVELSPEESAWLDGHLRGAGLRK